MILVKKLLAIPAMHWCSYEDCIARMANSFLTWIKSSFWDFFLLHYFGQYFLGLSYVESIPGHHASHAREPKKLSLLNISVSHAVCILLVDDDYPVYLLISDSHLQSSADNNNNTIIINLIPQLAIPLWVFKLQRIRNPKGSGEQWKKVLLWRNTSMHYRFKKGGS